MKIRHLAALAALAANALVTAAPLTFDFKDPKGVNNALFKLDAPLEAITGSAAGVSGTVTFDPEKPETLKGRIVVAANSMHVTNPVMKEHMLGKDWMDAAAHPEIVFETDSVTNVKTAGDTTTAEVTGNFRLKGVSKKLTVPVRLTYLPGKLSARNHSPVQGDLLVLRSTFTIKRGDFGINPKAPTDAVADEIEITLSLAGASPKS